MRDYQHFDGYLDSLDQDIYSQPPDDGHTVWAKQTIRWLSMAIEGRGTVLDVGCGQGFCKPIFERRGWRWQGVTRGEDFIIAHRNHLPVRDMDMTFLGFPDQSFNMIFARHVLEHSPFPLLTLMEWHRVARDMLVLVAPAPEHWGDRGRNHYMVLKKTHIKWLLERSGWKVLAEQDFTNKDGAYIATLKKVDLATAAQSEEIPVEHRFICARSEPVIE